jgi:hypothetical protein
MTKHQDAERAALLVHAAALLAINDPCRIVIDGHAPDVAGLAAGTAIRIIFEPPGVIRVYERLAGRLLAESEPGEPARLARSERR